MFHSRKLNNDIKQFHEPAPRLIYKDKETTYDVLLQKVNSVRVHHGNLQFLVTETFKMKNDL